MEKNRPRSHHESLLAKASTGREIPPLLPNRFDQQYESRILELQKKNAHVFHKGESPGQEFRPVLRGDGKYFDDAYAAAQSVGVAVRTMMEIIETRSEYGKFTWRWAIDRPGRQGRFFKVVGIKGRRRFVFETSTLAGASIGVKSYTIQKAIKQGTRLGGYLWAWEGKPLAKNNFRDPVPSKIPVVVTEGGRKRNFKSLSEAARFMNAPLMTVHAAVRSGKPVRKFKVSLAA